MEILSIYTIWDRLSLKTISRYCPFKDSGRGQTDSEGRLKQIILVYEVSNG
jgi:hypothetical protein